jgi:hypothetical protein
VTTPYWNRNFRRHDPLTHRFARTLAEAFPVSDDGIEGPDERDRRARRAADHPVLWMLALFLLCLIVTSPKWWRALFGG